MSYFTDLETRPTIVCSDCDEGFDPDTGVPCVTCAATGEVENPDYDPSLCGYCGEGQGRNHGGCRDL